LTASSPSPATDDNSASVREVIWRMPGLAETKAPAAIACFMMWGKQSAERLLSAET
jgi:hypothetical protein